MKSVFRSLFCLVLVMAMTLSLCVVPVFAEELQEDAPHDFVILLDCSGSLRANDPDDLCLEACKSFVDLLPSQNSRVAVLGFGYTNGPDYKYQADFNPEFLGDAKWVHEIVPMGDLNTKEDRAAYKEMVETVYFETKQGKKTPIGQAVSAGLDVLKKNGSADGNACIILITDGVDIPERRLFSPSQAAPDAKDHEWPIYCIGLNYNNNDRAEMKQAMKLLNEYCEISGNNTLGAMDCATPEDVYASFVKIFKDFYNLGDELAMLTLPAETEFNVPAMTSEATITVFGKGVEAVELVHNDTGETYKITENKTTNNLIAVVEKSAYYSVKMICPTEGAWKIRLLGEGGAEVQFSNTSLREMAVKMVSNAAQAGDQLTKTDRIRVDAFFSYRDFEVHNSSFYNANPATLIVRSSKGTAKEFDMQATKDGYFFDLPLSEVSSGNCELQVSIKHSMFRNGVKLSNIDRYVIQALPLEALNPNLEPLHAYVNSSFEKFDTTKMFINPDDDVITYTITCTNDRNVTFDYTADAGYITFGAGMTPGTFNLEIQAIDPDMVTPVSGKLTLVVEDREPVVKKIPKIELWIDCYGFQKDQKQLETVDLSQYITDPDNVNMTYTCEADSNILKLSQNGSNLELTPVTEGETSVNIVANDGISDVTTKFDVKVINGKVAFWRDNWIYFAITLAIIVIIILTIIILIKNKRVKGSWEITIDENGTCASIPSMNIADYTASGKKGKFLLKDLVGELLPYLDYPLDATTVLSYFSGNGAEKIEFVGVTRKKGCVVNKIPAEDTGVTVSNNGVTAKGKANVYGGTVTFMIISNDGFGGRLMITMRLL